MPEHSDRRTVVVVGGGAAGFFGAIRCAESDPATRVILCEATKHPLAKVRISGGGRCNVTHACFEPRELVRRYPRGARELIGAFHRFGPADTVAWFGERGVALKTEADGRMFPTTDSSATIVDALTAAARDAGVDMRTHCPVRSLERAGSGGFEVDLGVDETLLAERILVATGGNRGAGGISMAQTLGHRIEAQVPSLFAFDIADSRLRDLAGVSVGVVGIHVAGTRLRERGPILITHRGLSGPAVLRLSAWGARELHARGYAFEVGVDWTSGRSRDEIGDLLAAERESHPRRLAASSNPFGLPGRLWERLVDAAGVDPGTVWAQISNTALRGLADQVCDSRFRVTGKSMNKEEFVTCGGVSLREVDCRTMESRICPGLHFAGEVLDIDGITGGFNFQAAWTTGWLAGTAMVGGAGA